MYEMPRQMKQFFRKIKKIQRNNKIFENLKKKC